MQVDASSKKYRLRKHGRPPTAKFRVILEKDNHDIPLYTNNRSKSWIWWSKSRHGRKRKTRKDFVVKSEEPSLEGLKITQSAAVTYPTVLTSVYIVSPRTLFLYNLALSLSSLTLTPGVLSGFLSFTFNTRRSNFPVGLLGT